MRFLRRPAPKATELTETPMQKVRDCMAKKEYSRPDLLLVRFTLKDVIMSSPEDFNSHIDSSGSDWGDPIIDPDDDIQW